MGRVLLVVLMALCAGGIIATLWVWSEIRWRKLHPSEPPKQLPSGCCPPGSPEGPGRLHFCPECPKIYKSEREFLTGGYSHFYWRLITQEEVLWFPLKEEDRWSRLD